MKKYKRVIPFVTLVSLMFFFLSVIFFNNLVYYLNSSSYEIINAKVIEQGYDGLFSIIPKITVKYKYNNEIYKEDVLIFTKILFNEKIRNKHEVYVNKEVPNYVMYVYKPTKSGTIIRLIVIIFLIASVYIIINFIVNTIYYIINIFKRREKRKKDKEERIRKKELKLQKRLQNYNKRG